jgi:hypothetical protein
MMHWATTEYAVHFLTIRDSKPEIYRWAQWQYIFPIIDKLVAMSASHAAIRSSQAFEHHSGWLGFGRMMWNEKNNRKWTEKYHSPEYESKEFRFYDTEIWAPDWNIVFRESKAPDIFIKASRTEAPTIVQNLLIAIRYPIYKKNSHEAQSLVEGLSSMLDNCQLHTGTLAWAEEVYEFGGFTNGLSDLDAPSLRDKLVQGAA